MKGIPLSLVHALLEQAERRSGARAYTWLPGGDAPSHVPDAAVETATFGQVAERVGAVAELLRREGLAGARVLLQLDSGLDFIASFVGCLAAGAIPVPSTPLDPARRERTLPRLEAITRDCDAAAVLAAPAVADLLQDVWQGRVRPLTVDAAAGLAGSFTLPDPETPAFLQYTSGSTGEPKGVVVRHRALTGNMDDLASVAGLTTSSVLVSWLPHFHDLGLIFGLLEALTTGCQAVFMSPVAFLRRPSRWLQALHAFRGTHTASPNFGFELVLRKLDRRRDAPLDLSSVRYMMNAAETVRWSTVERFHRLLAPFGLSPRAVAPAFGLAEATLKVTMVGVEEPPSALRVEPEAFQQGRVVPAADGRPIVALGGAGGHGIEVRAVDPEIREPCGDDRVGELWVRGPHLADGYWNRPRDTERTFGARTADGEGPWLRTGDLGFWRDGQLYFAGRKKDLVIVRGQNHYPADIELTVQEAHPAVRPGCVIAFSIDGAEGEELVVVPEIDPRRGDLSTLFTSIRTAVADLHDLRVVEVVPVRHHTIPKTSSGKLQRQEARGRYLEGRLARLPELEDPLRAKARPTGALKETLHTLLARLPGGLPGGSADHRMRRGMWWRRKTPAAAPRRSGPDRGIQPAAAEVEAWLVARLARELGIPAAEIADDEPMTRLGLGSAEAVVISGELEEWLGRDLPPTLLWDYPTIRELAAHLGSETAVGG